MNQNNLVAMLENMTDEEADKVLESAMSFSMNTLDAYLDCEERIKNGGPDLKLSEEYGQIWYDGVVALKKESHPAFLMIISQAEPDERDLMARAVTGGIFVIDDVAKDLQKRRRYLQAVTVDGEDYLETIKAAKIYLMQQRDK